MSTLKHDAFVREPMRDKPADSLAGIGPAATAVFAAKGFEKAYHLFGQFLVLNKDEELFCSWLETEFPDALNASTRARVFACLAGWAQNNL